MKIADLLAAAMDTTAKQTLKPYTLTNEQLNAIPSLRKLGFKDTYEKTASGEKVMLKIDPVLYAVIYPCGDVVYRATI